jgi:hypothetical protein
MLTPYVDETAGDHQCGLRGNRTLDSGEKLEHNETSASVS